MQVNAVDLDTDPLVGNEGKWRSEDTSFLSIFNRKNIGFTLCLVILTAAVITGLVFLKYTYVPCSLANDASIDNVMTTLVCFHFYFGAITSC